MSRVTIRTKDGRTLRLPAGNAQAHIAKGATLDESDERGAAAYARFMHNRRPRRATKKPRGESKDKE